MKFKYMDEVTVTSGFYEGVTGKLTSCEEHYNAMEPDGSMDTVRYCLQISKDKTIMVDETDLELFND